MEGSTNTELPSSAGTRTPTRALNKRAHANGTTVNSAGRAGSEPVDPTVLSKALKDFEDARRTRDRTPGASPSRKRQRIYGDRSVHELDTASPTRVMGLQTLCPMRLPKVEEGTEALQQQQQYNSKHGKKH